jgi:enamine deaminase RidA (YjgF/YER057c/UK114 family)
MQSVHGGGYLQCMDRRRISSAMPLEQTFGYSRAIVVGDRVFVSGTAPVMPDGADPPPDAYGQARRCLEIILTALGEAGAGPEDVVRTRIHVTSPDHIDDVGRAHGEVFGDVRPATTGIVVAALFDPRWLVEIEAEAIIGP